MIFEKAYKELLAGKKIRRKEWEPLMHMRLVDNVIKTFKGEYSTFYDDSRALMNDGWMLLDGDGNKISFMEAIEALRNKKCLTRSEWIEDKKEQFIFIDNKQFALCHEVEFAFMPTWTCINSDDWMILK